jgi:hypothetical protein
MRKHSLILLTTILAASPAAAGEDEIVRTLNQSLMIGQAKSVGLEFSVGQLIVEAWDEPKVDVQVILECESRSRRCTEAAKNVKLSTRTGERLHVELAGWPKSSTRGLEARVRAKVPRNLPLKAELGVGQLQISGVEGDLDADLGVGEVTVSMPESAVGSVHVDVGIGDANLRTTRKRYSSSGLLARQIEWDKGTGPATVRVDCGVGEVVVALK